MFYVKQCVVLFKDIKKSQFFNIVYAEEDDRRNTFNAQVDHRKEAIKRLKAADALKNRDAIKKEEETIQAMREQNKYEVDSRNLVLWQD